MATVYLAEDLTHKRKVAVKVLRPELSAILGGERFLNEIKVTANLQHPNILPLYDSGEADTLLYYVMPYIEGETLRDKLNREKQLGVEETVEIAKSVAAALNFAHEHGVVHRDIKPENVLLQAGQALVADFGIALAVSAAGGTGLTETGLSLGTPHYMSPEQATGDRELDARSDVYSLGATVYEMLVGDPPHLGSSAQAVIAKILSEKPSPISQTRDLVPGNVDAAVQRALAKTPADRFASASEFAAALTNPAFTLPTTQAAAVASAPARAPLNRVGVVGWSIAIVATVVALWTWLSPEPPRPVIRYSMALPEGEESGPTLLSRFVLSPDGESFVYVGTGNQGTTQLLIRSRDQLHATALPGTETGRNPFFSPDGARVGFTAMQPTAVKVISLSGGPPITVADSAVALSGASWGPDERIYVATNGGLAWVRASGGAVEPLTTIDSASGETAHRWPEALPNGKGVLFTVWSGAESDIAVLDLATDTRQVLVGGVVARYVSSGHLLYVTASGTLMAAPFDQDAMTLTGEASALIEGLRVQFLGAVDLTLSAQGTLMYTTGFASAQSAELVWVTREGTVEAIDSGWTGNFLFPALSPDGTRLAVAIGHDDGQQLWIKKLDRGPLSKLTFAPASNSRPAWTPDGRAVAFVSQSAGHRDLYVRAADGRAQAELLRDEEQPINEVAYSHDGKWLVYQVGPRGRGDLYAARVGVESGPVPLVVTDSDETSPTLSPDGRWLAYVAGNDMDGYDVYVRPFPNTDDGVWPVSTDLGTEPVWAHSGRELFYRRLGGDFMSVEVLPGPTFVTGERRVLFSAQGFRSAGSHQQYDVTPDDQRFVMIRNLGGADAGELIVVENFFEELKAKVGN